MVGQAFKIIIPNSDIKLAKHELRLNKSKFLILFNIFHMHYDTHIADR